MAHLEKKIKFLATKLTSLQAELKVSREIMSQASREVDEMFEKKYIKNQLTNLMHIGKY